MTLNYRCRYFPDWEEMCQTLDLNTHLPKPVKEEVKEEKSDKIADEPDKKEEDKEKVGGLSFILSPPQLAYFVS